MKRRELVKRLTDGAARLVRHGGKHDWYQNQKTGVAQPVPRHAEIDERLARKILRDLLGD